MFPLAPHTGTFTQLDILSLARVSSLMETQSLYLPQTSASSSDSVPHPFTSTSLLFSVPISKYCSIEKQQRKSQTWKVVLETELNPGLPLDWALGEEAPWLLVKINSRAPEQLHGMNLQGRVPEILSFNQGPGWFFFFLITRIVRETQSESSASQTWACLRIAWRVC